MLNVIIVFFSLFIFGLTGWTLTTFVSKDDSQKVIKGELENMFDITKRLLLSIKSLIQILTKASFSSNSDKATSDKATGVDEQLLKFVPSISDNQEDKAA